MAKWGVQMWAGMSSASGQVSSVSSSRSRLSSPRMGRPSEWMLPMASSRAESSSAASREGSRIRLWTFRVSAVALVDAADLPGDDKPGRLPGATSGQAQILPQGVDALSGGHQLLPQLRAPGGVGEVPGAHQSRCPFAGPTSPGGAGRRPGWWPGKSGSGCGGRQCTWKSSSVESSRFHYNLFCPAAQGGEKQPGVFRRAAEKIIYGFCLPEGMRFGTRARRGNTARNREEARMTPTARAAAMPRVPSRALRNCSVSPSRQ